MASKKKDVWALVVRIIVGAVFLFTGYMKVSDMGATVSEFAVFGLSAYLAYIVTFCELAGGLLVLLGAWSRYAAGVLAVIMVFATWYSMGMGAFVILPIVVFILLVVLIKIGAGRYAVHKRTSAI